MLSSLTEKIPQVVCTIMVVLALLANAPVIAHAQEGTNCDDTVVLDPSEYGPESEIAEQRIDQKTAHTQLEPEQDGNAATNPEAELEEDAESTACATDPVLIPMMPRCTGSVDRCL
jgi:hypothetical protein